MQIKPIIKKSSNSIIPRDKLSIIIKRLRDEGKTIVTCNGVFDLLHLGHLRFLEEAKSQGDILIVGINSDSSVKLTKPDRPINDEMTRALIVASIKYVDYVTIFNEPNPRKLIEIIKPDVHVNGYEYGYNCIEASVLKKYGVKLYLVKRVGDYSTTNIIKKILSLYK